MELSLAVNASLVALSKFGGFPSLCRVVPLLIQPIQQSSARSLFGFRPQEELTSVALIRLEQSPLQILSWRVWLESGMVAL